MHAIRWSFLISVIAGCPAPGPAPSYYGGQPQPGQGGGGEYAQNQPAQGGGGLTCMQLFGCFQGCTDGPCIQNCLSQADATQQAAASAAMQCSAQKCGNGGGADCLQQQCSAEVAACDGAGQYAAAQQPAQGGYQQPAGQEQMIEGQPHTTANLLPWMTGDWIGTNHQFTFFGDGRVRRTGGHARYNDRGDYSCLSTAGADGTVRQEGDLLIMDFAPEQQNHCGSKDVGKAVTVRYKITWERYADTTYLQLNDIDCTAGAMWCNDRMRRR